MCVGLKMQLTKAIIDAIAPASSHAVDIVNDQDTLAKYAITSVDETAMFLGQCAAETGGFNRLEENLYYTTADRIHAVWPSRFTLESAAHYVRNPEALADAVYSGRLGNVYADDGWTYRGSGCIQTTGRSNFSVVHVVSGINCLSQPDLLREFPGAFDAAGVFWQRNNLARFVPGRDIAGLTKAINGGLTGLADRQLYTARAFAAFAGSAALPASGLLRNGSASSAVEALQTKLVSLGFELGAVDGKYGDATERAVKAFQAAHGIVPADGIFGPMTAKVLNP